MTTYTQEEITVLFEELLGHLEEYKGLADFVASHGGYEGMDDGTREDFFNATDELDSMIEFISEELNLTTKDNN